jgi:5-methylcytosine-specific restriction endonuclease McrA
MGLSPKCKGLVRRGEACSVCGKKGRIPGWRNDRTRPTRTERGYGHDWTRARAAKLRQDPLCEPCERAGRTELAVTVHHKIPFDGPEDPLRLDWANLESHCRSCHKAATEGRNRVE